MKTKRTDLKITKVKESCYQLFMRKRWLFLFNQWVPLTYQESENSEELTYEFNSFEEANEFIEIITD